MNVSELIIHFQELVAVVPAVVQPLIIALAAAVPVGSVGQGQGRAAQD